MKKNRIILMFWIAAVIYILVEPIGGYVFGWMTHNECFTYLGCNVGFFGYDALVHFFGGILETAIILLLAQKFAHFDIFHKDHHIKNLFILLGTLALIAYSWEFFEYCVDHYHIFIQHKNIFQPLNIALQSSNSDTMGDIFFGILGGLVGGSLSKLFGSDVF